MIFLLGPLNIYTCVINQKRIVNPKINHDVMLQNMRAKGFWETWLSGMRKIFELGTSTILLNGVLGKTFHYRKGVRYGVPLTFTFCSSS